MPAEADATRSLIVNADDFGLTNGVNRGIIEAHEHGIVTSASLMVRYPAATQAAQYAAHHPELSVGLHFDISEWRYTNEEWSPFYVVVDADEVPAVRRELEAQLATFEHLMGRPPSHLDSHQHAHSSDPVRSIMLDAAARLNVPLRDCTPAIAYRGDFYGQTGRGESLPEGISAEQLRITLETLAPGWSELGCHPGYAENLDSTYRVEREREIATLCHADVRLTLARANVTLCSFHDFAKRRA